MSPEAQGEMEVAIHRVRTALVNADSASMARERLSGGVKERLYAWLCSPTGGRRGAALLASAAGLDTSLTAATGAARHPLEGATVSFGIGLAVAGYLRSAGVAPGTFAEALTEIGDASDLLAGGISPDDCAELTDDLLCLDPALEHELLALTRLGLAVSRGARNSREAVARTLFLGGLVAGGAPSPPALDPSARSGRGSDR